MPDWLASPQVFASVVGATASVIAATLSYYFSQRKAHSDARLDYEYEARKRLYEECQPIVFQLIAASAGLWGRLSSMAERTAEGHLKPGESSWMRDGYYARSTTYRLFRVLALGHLLRSKLTLFDATLDANIFDKFVVTNVLDDIICGHFDVAKEKPEIVYSPYARDRLARKIDRTAKTKNPAFVYQGLVRGEMQSLVESMIGDETRNRVMGWSEFDTALKDTTSLLSKNCKPLRDLFWDFHPDNRPVLWRILIGYSLLSRALMENPDKPINAAALESASRDIAAKFDHRPSSQRQGNSPAIAHLDAVRKYVTSRLDNERQAFGHQFSR
jgi:hypothetical protein